MRKKSKNTFNDGMSLDVHASSQSPATSRFTRNFRIFTRDNNSFIMTNMKGNKHVGSMASGYVPLATKDVNGVCYILSAQIVDGVATGRGEIGTFPSPDYDGDPTVMTWTYRALRNYGGDGGEYPLLNGPFNSALFDFDLVNLLSIELQMDYDGTINVIFTDGKNPMRIINSGFSVTGGMTCEIINRSGTKDSNRYTPSNFENTIQLVSRSGKILHVEFTGNSSGGQVPCGNVQYLFAYATSDGNETEIVGSSLSIPVYNGDRVSNMNGGKNTGDRSDKINRLRLTNVDESYASVVLYYVLSSGMLAEDRTAYRISQPFNINGPTLEISHTGFEITEIASLTNLLSNTVSIDTAARIAQVDGHLVAADITEKLRDYDAIREWGRKIKLGHKEVTLDLIGTEDGFGRATSEPLTFASKKAGTDGYSGGYANPKNVHDYLGNWGGEAYPYAFRLIFPDGTKSPAFPCIGIDNVTNGNLGFIDGLTDEEISNIPASGFTTDGKMINNMGIYRFPNRGATGTTSLYYTDSNGEGRITVFGITFKIPSLDVELSNGKKITDLAIGIQFLRGERRPDVLLQGVAFDAIMVPAIDYDHANTDEKTWNYNEASGGFTEGNSKFVPAFGHVLESADVWDSYGSPLKRSNSDKSRTGIEPFLLNVMRRDPHLKITSAYKSVFGLYSTDIFVNPGAFTSISNLLSSARILHEVTHQARVKTGAAGLDATTANHFSVLVPTQYSARSGANVYGAQSAFANDGNDLINTARFSTVARFQGRDNNGEHFRLFRNRYNSYMGIRLNGTPFRMSTPAADGEIGVPKYGMLGQVYKYSFLANIYGGTAQRTADQVAQVYSSIDNISYFPISQPMYFSDEIFGADENNTLEGKLDANRKITVFGGDCFISMNYRKVWQNAEFKDPEFVDKSSVVRTGYTIGVVNEGRFNGYIRSSEVREVTEGERRHPWDYSSGGNAIGSPNGAGASWREYQLYESSGYNKGLNMTDGNLTSLVIPPNTPYVRSRWRTRVWATAKHIPNSFQNGYRDFSQRTFRDYPTKYGPITQLITNNKNLFLIQERAVGRVIVNEKVPIANANGGALFVSTGSVLSDLEVITEEIGSKHMHSIASTDNGLYGVSTDTGTWWAFYRGEFQRVSDGKIKSLLDKQYVQKVLPKIKMLSHDIVTEWNRAYAEVVTTFYVRNADGTIDTSRTFTIVFSEITGKIHSFAGFTPHLYARVGEKLISFSPTNRNQFWQHDHDDVPFAHFYGVQDKSVISVVPNIGDEEKSFSNLVIEGNNVLPESAVYRVQGAKASNQVRYEAGDIRHNNAKYENGEVRITIPKINEVHHQDAEQKIDSLKAGARSQLKNGSRVKGKYMIAELTYPGDKAVEIKSINTIYKSLL